jgi:hypothetical protein
VSSFEKASGNELSLAMMSATEIIDYLPNISFNLNKTFRAFVNSFGFDSLLPHVSDVYGKVIGGDATQMKE